MQPGLGPQGSLADSRVDRDKSFKTLQQQVVTSMQATNHPLLSVIPWQDSQFFSPHGKMLNDTAVMERLYRRKPSRRSYPDDGQGNAWHLYRNAVALRRRSDRLASVAGRSDKKY